MITVSIQWPYMAAVTTAEALERATREARGRYEKSNYTDEQARQDWVYLEQLEVKVKAAVAEQWSL